MLEQSIRTSIRTDRHNRWRGKQSYWAKLFYLTSSNISAADIFIGLDHFCQRIICIYCIFKKSSFIDKFQIKKTTLLMNPEEKSANQIIMTKELRSIVNNVIESNVFMNILQYV